MIPFVCGREVEKLPTKQIEKIDSGIVVTMTTYTTSAKQTDSTPFVTASGFKLDSINPKKHRIIAISRDLRDTFDFGDSVYVEAGKYSGVYRVHDLMNKRFTKKIDILINPNEKGNKLHGVTIRKLD